MSYDKLFVTSHFFGVRTVGSTFAGTQRLPVPRGARSGRVLDISVNVGTLFTQVTTPAFIRVGVSGTLAKFAELNLGAAAANTIYNFRDNNGFRAVWQAGVDNVDEWVLTFVDPTGGTPAGVASSVEIQIGWDNIGIN